MARETPALALIGMSSRKRTSRGLGQARCINPRVATWPDLLMAPNLRIQRLESVASQEMQTLQGPKCWSKSRHLLLLADIRKPPFTMADRGKSDRGTQMRQGPKCRAVQAALDETRKRGLASQLGPTQSSELPSPFRAFEAALAQFLRKFGRSPMIGQMPSPKSQ
ncbi:hypothetical protein CFAM422_005914 [Trichoderma lentiforme]|uniref:Uncharacterized protein n=1 Tax=Trichoderma lentiforme TaxID=1567552 RepID=A0A9P4XHC8_9HYPO|nr:hypothetical protein CFAM422_005914 [Trichoderma lentiforme]